MMKLSREERRALGQYGRAFVYEHYGLEQLVGRWDEMYRSVLAQKGLAEKGLAPGPKITA